MNNRTRIKYGLIAFFALIGMLQTIGDIAAISGFALTFNRYVETKFIAAVVFGVLVALANNPKRVLFGKGTDT